MPITYQRVSIGLTVSPKTAKNVVVRRKIDTVFHLLSRVKAIMLLCECVSCPRLVPRPLYLNVFFNNGD